MTAAVTLQSSVVAVHVMAVVAAFGVLLAAPLLGPGGVLGRAWLRVLTPGAVLVLLTGAWLASDEDAWGEPWVTAPLGILVLVVGLVHVIVVPAERRLGAGDGTAATRWRVATGAGAALVLVAVYVMVTRPGA